MTRHAPCPGCGDIVDRYGAVETAVVTFCSVDCRHMVELGGRASRGVRDIALSMLVVLLSAVAMAGIVRVLFGLARQNL